MNMQKLKIRILRFIFYPIATTLRFFALIIITIYKGLTFPNKHSLTHSSTHLSNEVSPLSEELLLSGVEMARRVRHGMITSERLVRLHIEHIKKVNPFLNAVVNQRFDQAVKEAIVCDEFLNAKRIVNDKDNDTTWMIELEESKPYYGVPCTTKENFSLTGMPQTCGLVGRNFIAENDAPTVNALRNNAGAIILGTTNLSELALWYESHNPVYGRTNNVYKTTHMVGGSTGGEASIISAAGSPFGLGADIGGSIRMPAFFCGIFGHKPSPNLVDNAGQFPVSNNAGIDLLATGPLCRSSDDLWPLLRILSTTTATTNTTTTTAAATATFTNTGIPPSIASAPFTDMSKVHVISIEELHTLLATPVTDDIKSAQRKVVETLRRLGSTIVEDTDDDDFGLDDLSLAAEMWSAAMSVSTGSKMIEIMRSGSEDVSVWEKCKSMLKGTSPHTAMALALAVIEPIPKIFKSETEGLLKKRSKLKEKVVSLLSQKENTIILLPTHPNASYPHMFPIVYTFNFLYTALFNTLELPVTQIPLGLNENGLPIGIQIAALPNRDDLTIGVAMQLEKAGVSKWINPFHH